MHSIAICFRKLLSKARDFQVHLYRVDGEGTLSVSQIALPSEETGYMDHQEVQREDIILCTSKWLKHIELRKSYFSLPLPPIPLYRKRERHRISLLQPSTQQCPQHRWGIGLYLYKPDGRKA